jgi:predicted acetyltransferase
MTGTGGEGREVVVRTIEAAEIDAWVRCMSTGFLSHPADGDGDYWLGHMVLGRSWGAFDGDEVVGTLRSFPTPLTVPGPAPVTSAALTNVTVAPTHRRRGILTEMITNDLRASAALGEPVGILIASEYPIYGRFGYGPAVDAVTYTLDATAARFRRPAVGSVELVDLPTLRREGPGVYERVRAVQPGALGRDELWWDRRLQQVEVPGDPPPKGYQVLYRAPDGEVQGYLRYTAKQEWDLMRAKGTLTVTELVAASVDAYHRLWRYCCEVDLITTVQAGDRSVDEALVWLLHDARVLRQSGRFDFVWVRVLDVAAALSARRYATEESLVIEVVDSLGITGGRYVLDGSPAGAACTPSDASADLTLPVDALGSVYLGGMSVLTLAQTGRIDEHTNGAVARADTMFRSSTTPWCSTWF